MAITTSVALQPSIYKGMNNAYKQKLEFKISHAESNLRYLILNEADNTERVEDIKKEVQRCKNELQDYIALSSTPTPTQ